MALIIIHQHRVFMKINSKSISRLRNLHLILKVHLSSMQGSVNRNTCHPRMDTKAQEATEFTQGCHDMEADPVIITMNFHRMKQASSSSKYQAVHRQHQLPAINNQAQASGTFHLTIRIIQISIPLTIIRHHWVTLIMDTTISKTS
jgi:hypothetical protein